MRTNEYPYYDQPFDEYNVVQSSVIPFADKDNNLVISLSTATGKTALACAIFGYHLSVECDSRLLYVSPFKSLSSEKFEQWSLDEQLAKHGIMLNTGDNKPNASEYITSRLAVITNESFDSKTRNESYLPWLEGVSCVVFDEAHLLGTNRGAAMESAMMRFTEINKDARIVLLSATMSNVEEIAKWVKSLNHKATKFIYSDWRPNNIDIKIRIAEEKYNGKVEAAIESAISEHDKKTIVFVHSKKIGTEICKRIRGRGARCAFHNASLSQEKRKKIEGLFNNDPNMNILVSTSTLSAGVNLG